MTSTVPNPSRRKYLEAEVAERARHGTAEEVRTTCSFARAERLLGREYHGRFLIELLQNAADAWRSDPRSLTGRSPVAVVVGDGPALLVANQGAVMTPEVVIESLGHIGASTKSEGEAIGHKGIGFKSVLEITLAPEIYSGLQEAQPGLAVSFDPQAARTSILRESPRWDELLTSVQGLDPSDELAAVPILRFPHWVDELPDDVGRLAEDGFDTVVRLPFDTRSAERLGLDEDAWLATVRNALDDVSDQILLLLGCFADVRIEDRLAATKVLIQPEWDKGLSAPSPDRTSEEVTILRDGEISSTWRLFRRTLPALEHLAGEVAVGLRCAPGERTASVVPAVDGGPSAPFHLFFPTRIASGLPFLLHGYFEVDASRTGFYRGSTERNRAILDELATLVAEAVRDAAEDPAIDLVTMVDLIAACDEPEDVLAREFRELVLGRLDRHGWIPVADDGTGHVRARPDEVLVAKPELTRHLARVFSSSYLSHRVQLRAPEDALTDRALELIAARQPRDQGSLWEILADLCRPGATPIWQGDDADRGFRALLDLLDALEVEDRAEAKSLIEGLRGDPDSCLLPASETSGGRQLLPVPDPSEGVAGRRSRLVMARARATKGEALVPPEELDLAFLPEGLLASEADIDRAKPLGVRPFTVDNVLDRLNGISESGVNPEDLLRFLWRLLSRERASGFGTKRAAERAALFDPSQWFWCRPGRAREDETSRLRQQRERYLAEVPVPCRDGGWRRAGSVGFGADWADWIESGASGAATGTASHQRASAYRALEAISPGPGHLLASPAVVLSLFEDESFNVPMVSDESEDPEETLDDARRNAERHAFLLRLGIWEVPPLEAFESRDRANRSQFPWDGPVTDRQQAIVVEKGGWTFGLEGWGGQQHHNVYLAEDYRFLWSIEAAAKRDAGALTTGLRLGTKLYADRLEALVFCPQCRDDGGSHTAARYSTPTSGYPSCLALQLQHEPWVACTLDGSPLERPVPPIQSWWREKPPTTGSGLRQSPWRLLPLCGPAAGVTDELRRLAGINTISGADLGVVRSLLDDLRRGYEQRSLPVDPASSGSARQAFVGMHRLSYERLAELASDAPSDVAEVLAEVGVLCEFGDGLVYRPPQEARHDDGRFSTYVRHFVGIVPFLVLPRDQEVRAARIGVPQFFVRLTRRGSDEGEDVTDELRGLLGDRFPELLAIVVNHSLGTQTLELASLQFEERARRLQALTVRRTPDLVIDASIEGSSFSITLGEGSDQDVFLESPTAAAPVLYHDLHGDGWQDRLRRKIAPHLAAILENSAYAHTFALFLQAETDAEREEFLLELGISGDDVEAVTARIGVVGEAERQRHLRWYHAVLNVLAHPTPNLTLDEAALTSALTSAGLDLDVVSALIDAGGGETVRRDVGEGSPLRLLNDRGVDLASLDAELRGHGDAGLTLSSTKRSFARWIEAYGRRVSAVLASRMDADVAKSAVRALEPPAPLALSIDPPLGALLGPITELLASVGLTVNNADLALDPLAELLRIGSFDSVEALDEEVLLLFDEEEQRRVLRERAAQWRREIRMIAVLTRMGPAETRSTIRALDDAVGATLAGAPARPSDLAEAVGELFVEHVEVRDWLADQLNDSILGQGPDRDELLARAGELGVPVNRLPDLQRALDAPRRDHARAIKERSDRLHSRGLAPAPPAGLKPAPTRGAPGKAPRKKVTAVKVGESHDRRKRELGDEGEQWALAAVVGQLLRVTADEREQAIEEASELFALFEGSPVDAALSHAALARSRDIDDEELIDELTGLLHVSRHSDAFGFDLVGWLPLTLGAAPTAVCLEVKSSSGEGFHLSSSEWSLAQRLHDAGEGDRYAVLVVRRAKRGGLPSTMDLLVDPVSLFESGQLRRDVDGYKIAYQVGTDGSVAHTDGSLS